MKLETAFLLPAADRRVRKPDGSLLAEAGEELELTPYWRRRLGDEDVKAGKHPAKTKGNEQ